MSLKKRHRSRWIIKIIIFMYLLNLNQKLHKLSLSKLNLCKNQTKINYHIKAQLKIISTPPRPHILGRLRIISINMKILYLNQKDSFMIRPINEYRRVNTMKAIKTLYFKIKGKETINRLKWKWLQYKISKNKLKDQDSILVPVNISPKICQRINNFSEK